MSARWISGRKTSWYLYPDRSRLKLNLGQFDNDIHFLKVKGRFGTSHGTTVTIRMVLVCIC